MKSSDKPLAQRLKRALTRCGEGFSLFFIRCNLPLYRKKFTQQFTADFSRPIINLSLNDYQQQQENVALDQWIHQQLLDTSPESVLFLYDLELLLPTSDQQQQHRILQQLNWRRNSFAKLNRPVVIWLPEYALTRLAKLAPDFYDWYSGVYELDMKEEERPHYLEMTRKELEIEESGKLDLLSKSEKLNRLHSLLELLEETLCRGKGRALLLLSISSVFSLLHDYDTALKYGNDALIIAKEIGDKLGESVILNNISKVYFDWDNLTLSLSYIEQAIVINQELGERKGESISLTHIARIYRAQGNLNNALDCLKQALVIQQEVGDIEGEGDTKNILSFIYRDNGEFDTALYYLKNSLQISKERKNKVAEGVVLNNVSQIYRAKGETNIALDYLEQALVIQRGIKDKLNESITLGNIAQIYHALGDYDATLSHLNNALNISISLGDKKRTATSLNNISQVHTQRGDLISALANLKQAKKLAKDINDYSVVYAIEFNIGIFYLHKEEYKKAKACFLALYQQAKSTVLDKSLSNAYEKLADDLGMEGGIAAWDKLAE